MNWHTRVLKIRPSSNGNRNDLKRNVSNWPDFEYSRMPVHSFSSGCEIAQFFARYTVNDNDNKTPTVHLPFLIQTTWIVLYVYAPKRRFWKKTAQTIVVAFRWKELSCNGVSARFGIWHQHVVIGPVRRTLPRPGECVHNAENFDRHRIVIGFYCDVDGHIMMWFRRTHHHGMTAWVPLECPLSTPWVPLQ